MGKFTTIRNYQILDALQGVTRQYLVGDLSRPQQLDFLRDERLEIGISCYPDHCIEPAHVHSTATEYQYVISGWTEYLDIDSNLVHTFRRGDFYAILPGTSYAQKIKAGTTILFIKTPSTNDKTPVRISADQQEWQLERLSTKRTDYFHSPSAPTANSIRPASAVAILNDHNELLMLHRKDNGKWTMPGGTMELDESLEDCALREVREESGLNVVIRDIIGTYTDPDVRIAYSDGEVRREFTILYYGVAEGFDVSLDEESSQFRWVPLDNILTLPLADSQRRRLQDVIAYLEHQTRHLG